MAFLCIFRKLSFNLPRSLVAFSAKSTNPSIQIIVSRPERAVFHVYKQGVSSDGFGNLVSSCSSPACRGNHRSARVLCSLHALACLKFQWGLLGHPILKLGEIVLSGETNPKWFLFLGTIDGSTAVFPLCSQRQDNALAPNTQVPPEKRSDRHKSIPILNQALLW